jgi:uncharacterized phosphosugar-binding protein
MLAKKYFDVIYQLLKNMQETQMNNIYEAADVVCEVIKNNGILHVFGTGHSHMLAEEPFYRAGGLVSVNPIFEPSLMLHEGALKSSYMERLEGFAEILAEHHKISGSDAIIISSNSGRNAVPIEMAIAARKRGAKVIVITCLAHSKMVKSRHSSGKRLFEVADIVIDNCGVPGDAILEVNELPQKISPTSTVTGVVIMNSIIAEAIERLLAKGIKPLVFQSANSDGGEQLAGQLIQELAGRIKSF